MSASKTRRSHPSRVTIDAREAGHSHLPSVSLRSPRPLYSGHPLVSFLPQQSLYTRVALQTLRTRGSWYSWSSSRPFLRDTPAGTTGAGAACSSVTLCSVTISSVSVSTEWLLGLREAASIRVWVEADVEFIRSEGNISSATGRKILEVNTKYLRVQSSEEYRHDIYDAQLRAGVVEMSLPTVSTETENELWREYDRYHSELKLRKLWPHLGPSHCHQWCSGLWPNYF